jgi:hypothetical protein
MANRQEAVRGEGAGVPPEYCIIIFILLLLLLFTTTASKY